MPQRELGVQSFLAGALKGLSDQLRPFHSGYVAALRENKAVWGFVFRRLSGFRVSGIWSSTGAGIEAFGVSGFRVEDLRLRDLGIGFMAL